MIEEGEMSTPILGFLRDARLLALAVSIGMVAAFFGGLLIGWASTGKPSTFSQAIQQANNGALPLGTATPASKPTRTTPKTPSPSPESLYELAFFGFISSISGDELGVETKAGQIGVALTAKTQFAIVNVAESNRSNLANGRLVLIVPASSNPHFTGSNASTVVLLPN